MKPTVVLLAGPNGAGKSTLYDTRVAGRFAGPFINADIIQREELNDPSMEASYRAARVADERRAEMLSNRRSFATETVFSHPSKLDVITSAQNQGFNVIVMHVGIDSPDLAVARVEQRHADGGHDVPERKIRERYDRSGPLIRRAVLLADRGLVFDNSALNRPPEHMLTFVNGRLSEAKPSVPDWVRTIYAVELTL